MEIKFSNYYNNWSTYKTKHWMEETIEVIIIIG